jgi:DNA polymerase III subunit beta
MKCKVDRATLLKALTHIQSVVEKRSKTPILANVLLSVKQGKLSLTATDMEIAIIEEISVVDSSQDGVATAPAITLYDIVRKLPDGAVVDLDHPKDTQNLALRAGRYKTSLVVLPVEDFPNMTAGKLPHQFRIQAMALRGMIDRTWFAISTEETRYYLNGIYFHAVDHDGTQMLRAVATDGHRLARVEESLPEGAESMPGVILPRKAVGKLRKLLEDESGEIAVSLSDTRIQFQIGALQMTSKLIDGTFPEYERVIPVDNDKVLRIGKKSFADAVARVSAISSERSRPIKLSMEHNLLTLSSDSPDQGTAMEELDSDYVTYDSTPVEIGFQARYLTDITDQITGDVEFIFADGAAPTLVRDSADSSALYVLMPMRV